MDLKEFVTLTLEQIIGGVKDAQLHTKGHGASINPHFMGGVDVAAKQGLLMTSSGAAQLVHFDVALTAAEGQGTKGGIGVAGGLINIGAAGHSQQENSTVSRVSFSVLLTLPHES